MAFERVLMQIPPMPPRRAFVLTLVLMSVATAAPAQPARWVVAPTPSIRLGGDETDTIATFAVVEGATRLPDGSILVGDRAADFALKRFSAQGALLQRFARKGTGPGEIDYLARFSRCGDSIYTYDVESYRQQVFTLDGRYVRLFRFGGPGNTPYRTACNADVRFVHFGWETRGQMKGGIYRGPVPVWMSRADSAVGAVFDPIPGSERWGHVADQQLRGSRPLPLGKEPVIGIGLTRVYLGTADRFELGVFDFTGRRVATLRRDEPPQAVTSDDIRDYVELQIAERGDHRRASVEREFAAIEFPKTLPAYTALVVDSEDLAWVRHFPRGAGASVKWTVFSSTGAIVAEVEVPRHLEVNEIGREYLLGRWFDPDDAIPEVRLYALRR